MNSAAYQLSSPPLTLRDYTDPDYRKMLDASAQSGDYLISLAAELNHIAIEIRDANPEASKLLINLARDLGYIDDQYVIAKKPKK